MESVMTLTVTQPKAISITDARAEELQMWLRRGHLTIEEPNPGRGKSRSYTSTDCVKIALMVRLFRFGVEADRVAPVLTYVERRLEQKKTFGWNEFFVVTFRNLGQSRLGTFICADSEGVSLGISEGDGEDMCISAFSEWFRSIEVNIGARSRRDNSMKVVPSARRELAELGAFAEPFLYFPLGEIVNGTLARFDRATTGANG